MKNDIKKTLILLSCTIAMIFAVVGCNKSGGGDNQPATSSAVTLTYPSGRIMATGAYEPGTTTKTGEWKEYFDQDGSPQQWLRNYKAGTWDKTKDWREWNADASIRNDASDH